MRLLDPPNEHWFRNRAFLAGIACALMSFVPPLVYLGMAHPARTEVLIDGLPTRSLPVIAVFGAGLAFAAYLKITRPKAAIAVLNTTVFVALFTMLFVGLR